ncbi:MAG: LTA synthase family protein [Clostridia bacterium]|nr:LTA synthase family protein [Clostridia bacterium]
MLEENRKAQKSALFLMRPLLFCLLLSALLTLGGEALSRRGLTRAMAYVVSRPHAYLYNVMIVALTLSPALLLKRRIFYYTIVSVVWAVLHVVDMITRMLRITPFAFYDVYVFFTNLDITNSYVTLWQVGLIVALVLLGVFGLIALFRHAPRVQPQRSVAAAFMVLLASATVLCTMLYAPANDDYNDPVKGFNKGGFAYSFLRSFVDRGVDKPEEYDKEVIADIRENVEEQTAQQAPGANFIFLQMESFVDPVNFVSMGCTENPVPHFTRLKEECSTGYLRVPMIGGGTANVEFEVVTGMRLSDFGTGEYPYTTILQSETCESVAYDLKSLGYTAHAIHNNTATFYNRNLVLPMLGFDTFTSLEYMQDVTKNPLDWCRDAVLTQCILDALESTEAEDLVFAVSVQGHGKYVTSAPETPYPIQSTGIEENESLKNAFEYYINQLRDMDAFLGELTTSLAAYPEPVVLVIYGDHLPALDIEESDMRSGSLLMTEYVLWSNDGSLQKEDRDIAAYQLTAYTLGRKGISAGVMMQFHQQCWHNEDYLDALAALEYDMLYGDKYLFDGATPYHPTNMRMGVKEITAASAALRDDYVIVRGEHFTPYSTVYLKGKALDTTYVDAQMLVAKLGLLTKAEAGDQVLICQVGDEGTVLSAAGAIALETE